ncbi:hypothetical protein ACXDF8_23780 [Mycolicibacterium sp. CBM1]
MPETRLLPAEFADLERFGDWILASEPQRYAERLGSTTDEMQELYDAGMVRLEEVMVYLDARFPLHDMPDDAKPRVLDRAVAGVEIVKEPAV